jgi:4-aminobutyrate aminotransferase-like enzyme
MLAEADYETMVASKGRRFLEGLRDLQSEHPEIGDVDGLGLALRMEMCADDGFTPDRELVDRMVAIGLSGTLELRGKPIGLVLDVGGYHKNVITLAPSLHISDEEIDWGIALLGQVLRKAKAMRGGS